MNRADLVASVAAKTGHSQTDAKAAVDAVFSTIADALKAKQEVRIHAFGTFNAKEIPAKKGRNPRTGEELEIPASVRTKFKPTRGLGV